MKFDFETDPMSEEFCNEIAQDMVRLFGISWEEAEGRINREWKGKRMTGKVLIIYHETANYWAQSIYYEEDVMWWIDQQLRVKPYP
ncbi:hypothetical protein LC55x_1447 [Lysobacter capsici]|uniref:hypothetical protein n=1 Tax=Lysobacter capsici TaxID=435897 RepID=UPI000716701A|nr:hypothetical protein [Lysobacter capsici]ALN84738.1 hypothetical protein LC55x_1447 [Lysobacter capsici]